MAATAAAYCLQWLRLARGSSLLCAILLLIPASADCLCAAG